MRTASRRRTWRPHPIFTRDLWHDLAPIGIGIVAAILIAGVCHATGRDVRSILDDVGIIHAVGLTVASISIHLLVTHAPTWFVRRRLSSLRARRARLEADIFRRRLVRERLPLTSSARRTLPPSLLRRVRKLDRISKRIANLERHERSLTRPSP
ncbi:hypothetical protein L0Y59_03490 [Candidatus Uhrbacteria bacterium]|nr:hypothetical protein [Candidatus Uhrbacteria bacterium]